MQYKKNRLQTHLTFASKGWNTFKGFFILFENLLHVASVCLNLFQDVACHSFRTNTAPLQLQPNVIVELNCKGSCTAS